MMNPEFDLVEYAMYKKAYREESLGGRRACTVRFNLGGASFVAAVRTFYR